DVLPVPRDVARAVTAGWQELGARGPLAVRSSATAEDLPGASFAGQAFHRSALGSARTGSPTSLFAVRRGAVVAAFSRVVDLSLDLRGAAIDRHLCRRAFERRARERRRDFVRAPSTISYEWSIRSVTSHRGSEPSRTSVFQCTLFA